jgi:hypothetical protein
VEVALVWALFAIVAVEILATYSRLPARELYHVSGSGLEGGASRALVFGNFPTALAALAVLALIFDSLGSRSLQVVACLAALLSLVVVWPGVVQQGNLDARPVNVVPTLGVLLALGLTVAVGRRGLARRHWQCSDWLRLILALGLVLLALPWFAAELGFFLPGHVFQTAHAAVQLPGDPKSLPAVHHGHHHGMDGLLLVLTALLLSRRLDVVRTRGLRLALSAYLALMLCYGAANIANDAWGEQVVKRGWTSWQIPSVLTPKASAAWGLIVLAAAIVWAISQVRPSGRHVRL